MKYLIFNIWLLLDTVYTALLINKQLHLGTFPYTLYGDIEDC